MKLKDKSAGANICDIHASEGSPKSSWKYIYVMEIYAWILK